MNARILIRRVRGRRGFTLVEVMIALTLLALIMTILYSAFYLSQRAVEKTRVRVEAGQSIRAVPQFLGSYLHSAYPYRSPPGAGSLFFSGDENRLSFVSAFSAGMGGRGFARVTLFWDEGANGTLTLDEETPLRLEGDAGGGYKNSIVLGQGIRDFRMDYLELEGDQERWEERWEGQEKKNLPRAVRLRYRLEQGGEENWIFPVMIRVLTP